MGLPPPPLPLPPGRKERLSWRIPLPLDVQFYVKYMSSCISSTSQLYLKHIFCPLEAILSSYAAVLDCSWHACSPQNIEKYSIFVGFYDVFENELLLLLLAFWSSLGLLFGLS